MAATTTDYNARNDGHILDSQMFFDPSDFSGQCYRAPAEATSSAARSPEPGWNVSQNTVDALCLGWSPQSFCGVSDGGTCAWYTDKHVGNTASSNNYRHRRFCMCKPGYIGKAPDDTDLALLDACLTKDETCVDVNECMHDDYGEEVKDRFGITNGACPSPFSNCVNTEGSYYCQCKPNFLDVYGNATLCTAQFCEAGLDNCDDNAACISAVGSFACACNTGYASRSQVGGGSAKQAPGTSGDCVAVGACERGDDFHADCGPLHKVHQRVAPLG